MSDIYRGMAHVCHACHTVYAYGSTHECPVSLPENVRAELPAMRARLERAVRVGATAQEWRAIGGNLLALIDAVEGTQ